MAGMSVHFILACIFLANINFTLTELSLPEEEGRPLLGTNEEFQDKPQQRHQHRTQHFPKVDTLPRRPGKSSFALDITKVAGQSNRGRRQTRNDDVTNSGTGRSRGCPKRCRGRRCARHRCPSHCPCPQKERDVPLITRGPRDVAAAVGSTVIFECHTRPGGDLQIQWFRQYQVNGSYIAPDGLPYVEVVKESLAASNPKILCLHHVTTNHVGKYVCLVGNSIDITQVEHASAWLQVIPPQTKMTYFTPKRHLTGNTLIWQPAGWLSDLTEGWVISTTQTGDTITMAESGLYHIYAQIARSHEGTVSLQTRITVNGHNFLNCGTCDQSRGNGPDVTQSEIESEDELCYVSGTRHLNSNDIIQVYSASPQNDSLLSSLFLGLVQIV